MMRRISGSESAALKAYKSVIDGMLFPAPRQVVLNLPAETDIAILSRPLRAETAQGPRVAIATSEQAPAGTTCTFTVNSLGVITEALLREWFEYGALRGLGGWRSASWGRFEYSMSKS